MTEKKKESVVKTELKALAPYFAGMLVLEIIAGAALGFAFGFDYRIFTGAIVGTAVSVLSFLLMAISAEKSLHVSESKMKNFSLATYSIRYISMFLILGGLMYFRVIHPIAAVLPLFVPKIAYTISAAFQKSEF